MTDHSNPAGPYRSAESYARGELTRDELALRLSEWQYAPGETQTTGPPDDLLNFVDGSFDEVEAAILNDLMDESFYVIALNALTSQLRARKGGQR